jgi:hypothetical protein
VYFVHTVTRKLWGNVRFSCAASTRPQADNDLNDEKRFIKL